MFKWFFTYANDIPDNVGLHLYGPGHLTWLAATVLAVYLITRRYRVLSYKKQRRMEIIICSAVLFLDLIRFVYQMAVDGFSPFLLPLHLCGLAVYTSLFNALRPGKIKQEILFSIFMPGAAMALLFPCWADYPILNIFCIFCFLTHVLLVSYPLMLFFGGSLKPDYKNLPKSLLFLVIIVTPIYIFNRVYGTNFMFINGTYGIFPLTLFERWFGNPGYVLGMLILLIIVWAGMYIPITLRKSKQKTHAHVPAMASAARMSK